MASKEVKAAYRVPVDCTRGDRDWWREYAKKMIVDPKAEPWQQMIAERPNDFYTEVNQVTIGQWKGEKKKVKMKRKRPSTRNPEKAYVYTPPCRTSRASTRLATR